MVPDSDSPLSPGSSIFVAGHSGLAGSAIVRALKRSGHTNIITVNSAELDLTRQDGVLRFFEKSGVDHVVIAAARVGGIGANRDFPVQFLYQNLMIETNIIHAASSFGVRRLLFLGSSCIYPKMAPQPIVEESLLTGELEPTNRPYALAKIAGIELCAAFNRQYGTHYRCIMPCNLYGPGDNFHPGESHVIPALVRRFHEAVERGDRLIRLWGSGEPLREFLHVDDAAAAALFLMGVDDHTFDSHTPDNWPMVNAGAGTEVSIAHLARLIAGLTRFEGEIEFDSSQPDGTPRKLMDSSRLRAMGWKPRIGLEEGLERLCAWYGQQKPGTIRESSVQPVCPGNDS